MDGTDAFLAARCLHLVRFLRESDDLPLMDRADATGDAADLRKLLADALDEPACADGCHVVVSLDVHRE